MTLVNFYEELDIAPSIGLDAVKDAIRKTRRRYRRIAEAPNAEQRRMAEAKMDLLAEADRHFTDDASRAAYDQQLSKQPAHQPEPARQTRSAGGGSLDWLERAKEYFSNGQSRLAISAAREATSSDPNNVETWKIRAYAALELDELQDAEFAIHEALRCSPQDTSVLGQLGDLYDKQRRYADAEQAFARAAAIEPKEPYWAARIAWTHSDRGNHPEAIQRAYTVLEAHPGNDYVTRAYAHILLDDAWSALSTNGNGNSVFTNKKQIDYVQVRLNEVIALNSPQPSLIEEYNNLNDLLLRSKKLTFIRASARWWIGMILYLLAGTWIVLWILTSVAGEGLGSFLWWAVGAGIVYLTFRKLFWRLYKVNRVAFPGSAGTGLK